MKALDSGSDSDRKRSRSRSRSPAKFREGDKVEARLSGQSSGPRPRSAACETTPTTSSSMMASARSA